jgi:predicted ATPase/DNA-binding CsgD family transcriptional regulator
LAVEGTTGVPASSKHRRHNLPEQRVRLIGREHDINVARQALLGAPGRLLTLTGAAGCGKTRLALELASEVLPRFPDGAWLVEFAALSDPALVPQAIVSALGVRERPGDSLSATLVRIVSDRELLLLLDNCEHVIDVCAQIVEELLDRCPNLRVLATSREALRTSGELTWRVPSLEQPDPRAASDDLVLSPAVQLFIERAQAIAPDFRVTARATATMGRICTRLAGLPLAIELAAARAGTLGVEQILERLDDSIRLLVIGSRTAPNRHQTLRATLDWSYGLLNHNERAVFRRMAVFVESCSLDATEAACADGEVSPADVVDLLTRLVDKSLVVVDEQDGYARYRLLEPVRQYAQEHLEASAERDRVRRRHALHYLAYAESRAHDTNIGGPRRFTATRELAREYPNIRLALAWSVNSGETQVGLRLAGGLLFYWQIYGSVSEGLTWVERLMAMPGAEEPTIARAWALLAAGYLANLHGDFQAASTLCLEGAELARRAAEPALEWIALLFLAVHGSTSGDVVVAEHYARQALARARASGDRMCEGQSSAVLALILCEATDYASAEPLAEEALRLARIGDDAFNEVAALLATGRAALGLGAVQRARSALNDGLSVVLEPDGHVGPTELVLDTLGEVDTELKAHDQARTWLVRSLELRHEGGERVGVGQTLERLAALAAATAQPERALTLAGAADALYEHLGARRTPAERQKLERWLVPLRETLDAELANAAWARGRTLSLDDAIALAVNKQQTDTQVPAASNTLHASMLTAREQEVAVLLARGMSNPQIAAELTISVHTAQRHVENILGKLAFTSRTQVATWAVGHDLVKPQSAEAPA